VKANIINKKLQFTNHFIKNF